jgi:hypothetical protein
LRITFGILLITISALSCKESEINEPVVARVGDRYLTMSELNAEIPDDLSSADSTELATNVIQSWMNRELMFEKAQYNLRTEQKEIDIQVEKYRQELFIFQYEKEIINQKLETEVSEQDIIEFYDLNQDIFQLNDYILKVRYIKLKPNSPDLEKVTEWIQSSSKEDQDLFLDYCHRYAVSCYNDSGWVYFNELLRELPIEVYNKESFLRTGKSVKFSDSGHVYLLYIRELQSKNTLSPIELEHERIKSLIQNRRKIELLNSIRRSLYKDAIRSGKAELYEEPKLP